MSIEGSAGILATWRARLTFLIHGGSDLRAIERVIEASPLDVEKKSVLWLWVWSRQRR
jgi:hypothetical protein